ncbi:MAG: hypothetical protein AB7F64_02535 [Gammaproteobacteria bacterium]
MMLFPRHLGHSEKYVKLALHIIENEHLNGEVICSDVGIQK